MPLFWLLSVLNALVLVLVIVDCIISGLQFRDNIERIGCVFDRQSVNIQSIVVKYSLGHRKYLSITSTSTTASGCARARCIAYAGTQIPNCR